MDGHSLMDCYTVHRSAKSERLLLYEHIYIYIYEYFGRYFIIRKRDTSEVLRHKTAYI